MVLSSCIDFFRPNLGNQVIAKYVVDGLVTDQEGYQTVSVSSSSTIDKPNYKPLSNCIVKIIDNHNNEFKLDEYKFGQYRVWIGKEYLKAGNSYMVSVLTSSGVEIVSDFDLMPECPEIDSIYYHRKDYPTTDPAKIIQGIQFYVDFDRKKTNSHYYRWEIDETWEHHAVYPRTIYLDKNGRMQNSFPPDYSMFICYTTERIKKIFTLSTKNIVQDKITMSPLHVVDNLSQRLTFCYSILVNQYSLSESAFRYWDQLRINTTEQGGLYSTQPLRIKGNLRNKSNSDIVVLGFFAASGSTKPKRIIVRNVENFIVYEPNCIDPLAMISYPYRYFINIDGKIYGLFDDCVECFYMSGSVNKPDFWPY